MSEGAANSRRMVYPLTFTARMVQFPYKYYWNNSWTFKYYIIGAVVCLPIFFKIQSLVNSPPNVAKFEALKLKEHQDHLEHLAHLK